MSQLHNLTAFTIGLLAIMNPLGNLAIFLSLTGDKTPHERKKIAITCGFSIMIILLLTTWFGRDILDLFGISVSALRAAGGLIIIKIGMNMMEAKSHDDDYHTTKHHPKKADQLISVVPLSIPIVAGPGAISVILGHGHLLANIPDRISVSIAVIFCALIVVACFLASGVIKHALGESGMKIATRVMGMLLVSIAMGMLVSGVRSLWGA